jgi:hypothetical protein
MLRRAFQNEEHAHQFMAGDIRFGRLQYYRKIEGCRQDETEGEAFIRWNLEAENPDLHNVTYHGSSLDPYYVVCTFHPAACKCRVTKFGSFIVCINEPLILLERICTAWNNEDRASGSAFIMPVLYNKGDLVEPPPYFLGPLSLTYAQKPASYSQDREYRYVLACEVGTKEDPFLTLKVGPCTDICSLIIP